MSYKLRTGFFNRAAGGSRSKPDDGGKEKLDSIIDYEKIRTVFCGYLGSD